MSEELLRLDKLPSLTELRFLVQEVFGTRYSIEWDDLSDICRSFSMNLAFSFENAVVFLQEISLVRIMKDGRIVIRLSEWEELNDISDDRSFCTIITAKLIDRLVKEDQLTLFFNNDTVKFDETVYSIALNFNLLPLDHPMIKVYLLNMGIIYPDKNIPGAFLVNPDHHYLFISEILAKVLKGSAISDLSPLDRQGSGATKEPLPVPMKKGLSVFISYSHYDEPLKIELVKHFRGLMDLGVIRLWHDGIIPPGNDWNIDVHKSLEDADIIMFLLSSDFMDSKYIKKVEVARAFERYEQGKVRIIPVILRPCDYVSYPEINKLQALPKNAKPVTIWDNLDMAYLDIVNQFKMLLSV